MGFCLKKKDGIHFFIMQEKNITEFENSMISQNFIELYLKILKNEARNEFFCIA